MRAWLCGLLVVPTAMEIGVGVASETGKTSLVELRAYPGSDPAM